MSSGFGPEGTFNPYQSTNAPPAGQEQFNSGKVKAPAIALLIFSILSLCASIFGVVNALVSQPPVYPPDTPEFVVEMGKNSVGPVAAAIQTCFIFLAVFILFASLQMMKMKSWGVSLAGSILSMVNFGSCCCVLGLPLGIWALIVLLMPDVKRMFEMNAR